MFKYTLVELCLSVSHVVLFTKQYYRCAVRFEMNLSASACRAVGGDQFDFIIENR